MPPPPGRDPQPRIDAINQRAAGYAKQLEQIKTFWAGAYGLTTAPMAPDPRAAVR
jgi:hypothetical protein